MFSEYQYSVSFQNYLINASLLKDFSAVFFFHKVNANTDKDTEKDANKGDIVEPLKGQCPDTNEQEWH